jgi:Cu2+-exporting ATPase
MGTSNVAISAKILWIKGDLQRMSKKLSHAVMKNINQNLFFAFFYNVLELIAAGVYILFLVFTFTDDCCMAMSFSFPLLQILRLRNLKL